MKNLITISIALIAAVALNTGAFAQDVNVWLLDEQGNKHFTCPVMGNEAVVGKTTKFSDYQGKRYYFCCPACKPAFEANPDKYLDKMVLPGNIIEVKGEIRRFKCPVTGEMGEVTKDTPYSDFEGKRYYLCCAECKPKFEAEPKKFITASEKTPGAQIPSCSECDGCGGK